MVSLKDTRELADACLHFESVCEYWWRARPSVIM